MAAGLHPYRLRRLDLTGNAFRVPGLRALVEAISLPEILNRELHIGVGRFLLLNAPVPSATAFDRLTPPAELLELMHAMLILGPL